jgi:hypothetical protein
MNTKQILGGATIVAASLSMSAAPALAGTLPKVSVRVEGKTKTLLRTKVVRPNGKRVRKDGHSCGGKTLLDPFNLTTRGRWSGPWYTGLGFQPSRILGQTASYTKTGDWFELFINNVAATEGLCSLKVARGDHVLMAAVPDTGTEFPIGISGPKTATAGTAFTVSVVVYNAKGRPHALKGATVRGGGVKVTTNARGKATIKTTHTGRVVLTAAKKGEIRSELVVKVAT